MKSGISFCTSVLHPLQSESQFFIRLVAVYVSFGDFLFNYFLPYADKYFLWSHCFLSVSDIFTVFVIAFIDFYVSSLSVF